MPVGNFQFANKKQSLFLGNAVHVNNSIMKRY